MESQDIKVGSRWTHVKSGKTFVATEVAPYVPFLAARGTAPVMRAHLEDERPGHGGNNMKLPLGNVWKYFRKIAA